MTQLNTAASDAIARDRSALREIVSRYVERGQAYALLDFPNHSNIGDSAIWAGSIALLKEITGRSPAYVCTTSNYNERAMLGAIGDGPVFLHGGGNFGDIYERHQTFREMIFRTIRDRQIVQMPQSIAYREPSGIARTAEAIDANTNVTLLVRDGPSFALANEHFKATVLMAPDAAFGLGTLKRPAKPTQSLVLLMRRDVESTGISLSHALDEFGGTVEDWPKETKRFARRMKWASVLKAILSGNWAANNRRAGLYSHLADQRVAKGVRILSKGRAVVTDRLHGHILSTLLGIPHVALDNDYRKVHRYIDQFTHVHPSVRPAVGPDAAIDVLRLNEKEWGLK